MPWPIPSVREVVLRALSHPAVHSLGDVAVFALVSGKTTALVAIVGRMPEGVGDFAMAVRGTHARHRGDVTGFEQAAIGRGSARGKCRCGDHKAGDESDSSLHG